ncbi:uncharacterized protein MAM_00968 [Metarhizium album ARSEF 1941]|uniref:Uncharacterized protein n=1 Tax=Metarhizium album (strain ARSEF 1941) TaxID=1081103 RepID=A0A0B2X0A1_METAS|nr:uncharacterized protein MAM_00968 [Metarhizium album ARSEF 1941]KHO01967.1 hypothetical protein MAM_00968 [Metarhizium album ARSEF 1941]
MSSPDPLNDSTMAELASVPPSAVTRRVTRSQSSQRFFALSSSPRKQTFELQVGDRMSPQRLLVTVETDGPQQDTSVGSNARRKLFQPPVSTSSTPGRRLRGRTTTTTVPLRESIEEDGHDGTTPKPKARGLQRKSNGTPMPTTGKKRRAVTPVRRTPRRLRTLTSADGEEPSSEASEEATVQATLTPRRRNLRPRKASAPAPSSEVGTVTTPRPSATRRGRRRRQALAPDELLELADEVGDINLDTTQLPPVTSEDEVDLVRAPSESTDDASLDAPAPAPPPAPAVPSSPSPNLALAAAESESDMWIGSATPRASTRTRRDVVPESSPRFPTETYAEPQLDHFETSREGYYGDYGYADQVAAASDRSSIDQPLEAEDAAASAAPAGYDTIAQGEDFSMIFMDSIPSLRADFHSSVQPVEGGELGDETNLIINNTLESLRQTDHDSPAEDDDTEGSKRLWRSSQWRSNQWRSNQLMSKLLTSKLSKLLTSKLWQAVDEQAVDEQAVDEQPVDEQAGKRELVEDEVIDRESTPIPQSSSPGRPSPRWSRSPRKSANSSPLRYRVLMQNALHTGGSPAVQTKQIDKFHSSPRSDRRLRSADRLEKEVSNPYEDSFSEIPEAVLTAATPRRPRTNMAYDGLKEKVDQAQTLEEDHGALLPNDDQQHDDEPAKVVEAVVGTEEQNTRTSEVPKQAMEQQEDFSQEIDEPEGENVEGSGEEDQAEEMVVGSDHEEEATSRQEPIQDVDGGEEMGEYDLVQQEESGPELESASEQQVLPFEGNDEEFQESEFEYDGDGLDDAELAGLETEQPLAMIQTVDADEEEEADEEDMDASPQLDEDHQEDSDEEMSDEVDQEEDYEIVDEAAAVAASTASAGAQSELSRLPTPDDTPPQPQLQATSAEMAYQGSRRLSSLQFSRMSPAQSGDTSRAITEQPREVEVSEEPEDQEMEDEVHLYDKNPEGDLFVSEARPEPPAMHETTRQSPEATPPQHNSSPVQEPASLQHETLLDKTSRPHLSTIIRAGRVLQSVTSDPPSPEGREKQLGSPFRRSGSKDSWTGSRDSQTSRRMSRSPLQNRGAAPTGTEPDNQAQPETSSSASRNPIYPSFLSPVRLSKEPSVERDRSDRSLSRQSSASSMHITPPSDGAMSWVEREGPISPNLRGDNSLREVAGLPKLRTGLEKLGSVERVNAPPAEAPVTEPPRESTPRVEAPEPDQDTRDDETDIWELEAQRETPRSVRQQPFGKRVPTSNNRRGAIPSPWTKRSVHRPAISRMISQAVPDLSHVTEEPSAVPDRPPPSSSPDEYSRLAQSQKKEAEAKNAANAPESGNRATKFDLSSFFSSPAAIPGMLAQKFMLARKTQSTAQSAQPSMSMAGQAPPVVPTNSMFPQIPQKDLRPDSSNGSGLFSPARLREPSSPSEQQEQTPEPQEQQPSSEAERSPPPATPEQAFRPTVAQKQNFTPRPGQASSSFFRSSSNPSAAVTPPRMQLSHADIHRWTQQASNASEASSGFQRPLLRPLPPKTAFPTKSSLRSPLKPRTPGRVVEFTSSVLSPAEQAKARLEDRSTHSNSILSQDLFAPPPHQPIVQDDKENASMEDVSMEDAPSPTKLRTREPLSQTTWSRQHWLLLDELLQYRRSSPFPVNYTRGADQYLGKTVKSYGEAMTLDRWHLDVVDAFKAEVGGWDADVLAKRLFALILGEARRMEARGPVERRVVFSS